MHSRAAHTLVELAVVLSILAALSGLLVPLVTGTVHDSQQTATETSLVELRAAMSDYWRDTKHIALDGTTTAASNADRLQITWMFINPVTGDRTFDFDANTQVGWRGPYVLEVTQAPVVSGSPSLIDAWNNEIVVHDVDPSALLRDVRIVSGGPDGVITIPTSTATDALTAAEKGDDVYVVLRLR